MVPGLERLAEPLQSNGLADTLTLGDDTQAANANGNLSSPPPQLAGLPEHEPLGMGLVDKAAGNPGNEGMVERETLSGNYHPSSTSPDQAKDLSIQAPQLQDSTSNGLFLSMPGSAAPGSILAEEIAPPPLNSTGPVPISAPSPMESQESVEPVDRNQITFKEKLELLQSWKRRTELEPVQVTLIQKMGMEMEMNLIVEQVLNLLR